MSEIRIGQIWRDTYGDGKPLRRGSTETRLNRRTIKIIGQDPTGYWMAVRLTDEDGQPARARKSSLKEATLLSGYRLISEPMP